MRLLQRVEQHLKQFGVPPARFGREAVGDPSFVFDLRDGRCPRTPTVAKVDSYMIRIAGEQQPCSR